MRKYKLRNARRKATFGIDGAIQAAAQLTATGLQIASDVALAKEQQRAMKESATLQADALKSQNENNNNLQQQSLEMIKDEKKRDRELQQDMQMTMQMQAARQNQRALQEANAIQVKNGGSARRKLRDAGMHSSLRGRNIPFRVTDGGSVIPIAITPEGYDLYEIIGNDHDHYHKSQGGKAKTGVGIKFNNGETIEGEGNQNTNQGELMLVTPNDAKFISRHTLKGFNPAKAVLSGMNPINAFEIQETIKDRNNISDDGKTTPVGKNKKTAGGDYTTLQLPYELINTLDGMNVRSLKCGGNIRRKALDGTFYTRKGLRDPFKFRGFKSSNNDDSLSDNNYMPTSRANLIGAGINATGNLISAGLSNIGNRIAQRYLTRGYNQAGNTLINAYNSLKTIDPSILSSSDFRVASPMAAIQTPLANGAVEQSVADRTYNRTLASNRRSGLSAAAIGRRNNILGVDYQDRLGQIQAGVNRLNQGIIQANMDRITDVSKAKAQLDTMANRERLGTMLGLLQYNNDIANERISGAAQARADMINSIAGVRGDTSRQNWSNIGNAINAGANAFGSAFQTNARMQNNFDYAMLGASDDSAIRWIDANPDNPNAKRYARSFWRRYRNGSGNYRDIADRYQRYYNF